MPWMLMIHVFSISTRCNDSPFCRKGCDRERVWARVRTMQCVFENIREGRSEKDDG